MAIKLAKNLAMQQLESPRPLDLPEVRLPSEPIAKPPAPKTGKAAKKVKPTFQKLGDVSDKLNISKGFCLITELHTNMGKYDKDRPYTRLHASDVTRTSPEFCPRERALLITTDAEPNQKYISTETRTYFDVGECYHDLVREVWGLPVSRGYWACQGCKARGEQGKKPTKCLKCGSTSFKYDELRVLSSSTGISCGIDWQIDKVTLPYVIAVEIKSINPAEFKKLHAPLAEHRVRTALYLHSIATATNKAEVEGIRQDMAYILYVSKGAPDDGKYLGGAGFMEKRTPFKIFEVTRDDKLIKPYLDKGRAFSKFRKTKQLPDRICASPSDSRADACSMCKECFK